MITILVLLGSFILLVAINVPVAFSMILACILALLQQGTIPMSTVTMKLYSGIDTFPFLAIPLFILAGGLMEHGGISQRLVLLAHNLVGHIKGGLGYVVVVATMFLSGITGSTIAEASALGSLLLPSMIRAGYAPARASAIVAAAVGMGKMIPPCLNMVVLGAIANISIAGLFMGGFLPGFLMALSLMVVLYVQSVRGILPRAQSARPPFRVVLVSLRDSLVPLLMPVIIFGGIFGGVFTATEAAAVSTVYAFLVSCFIYKELTIRALYRVLVDTAVLTGMTCLLVGAATTFSWILATHQVPRLIGSGIEAIGGGPRIFLLLAVTVFLVFGLVLDGLPAILIFFPILYPIATALQIHPLHFGILVIAAVEIAIVAPPLGLCLVIICSIAKVQLADTIRPSIPYISILIVDLIIMVFWPQLVLILPQLFKL